MDLKVDLLLPASPCKAASFHLLSPLSPSPAPVHAHGATPSTPTIVGARWQPRVLDGQLTESDRLILLALAADSVPGSTTSSARSADRQQVLNKLVDPASSAFEGINVFTTWDNDQIPSLSSCIPFGLGRHLHFIDATGKALRSTYVQWAQSTLRNPADVVFVTHILVYFSTVLPSALYMLFISERVSYAYGLAHLAYTIWCAGAFTLLLHNYNHQGGIFRRTGLAGAFDLIFPYLLSPLMGHTWNSYYYHHNKMHHTEGNGPSDLSSTIRYQRDSPCHFLLYLVRFIFLISLELPLYFWRKGQRTFAIKAALWDWSSYALILLGMSCNARAATFCLLLPFVILRIGLMIGNWGQHALVDETDPASDFRSSITVIDVASNRFCFNDGYHTSHHLNPRKHWRLHPSDFYSRRHEYSAQSALTFYDIDYLMITVRLLMRDYGYLADRLVPMGEEQLAMSKEETMKLLKRKTKRFTEDDIQRLFGTKSRSKNGKAT